MEQNQRVFEWAKEEAHKEASAEKQSEKESPRDDGAWATTNAYAPTHPWHYLAAGDGAAPVGVHDIPPVVGVGEFFEVKLRRNPQKRIIRIRELLNQEREQLATDKQRYLDVVERGVEALSRYDREIAYASVELAVASTMALKYTHISLGRGRVEWLEEQIETATRDNLFQE